MSTMPAFVHHQPRSLAELLELAERWGPTAKLLAGGTELVPKMRRGLFDPEHLISINYVDELQAIRFDERGGLTIGAGARLSDVGADTAVRSHYPALAEACAQMATPQIRNMATVAGNLVNGSPCADTAGPLLVHEAVVELRSRRGTRQLGLAHFFKDAGVVDIEPDEILCQVSVPPPPTDAASAFQRLSARSKVDVAAASATALLALDQQGRIRVAGVAIGAVAPTPLRCPAAETLLAGQQPEPALLRQAAAAGAALAAPIDDVRASAAYRQAVLPALIHRVLARCAAVLSRGGAP